MDTIERRRAEAGFLQMGILELVVVGFLIVGMIVTTLGSAVRLWREALVKDRAIQIAISEMEKAKEERLLGRKRASSHHEVEGLQLQTYWESGSWEGQVYETYTVEVYKGTERALQWSTKICF